MLFCRLGRAHSLREICGELRSSEGKLKHLGITAPNHSTLAYANEHRPWQLYRTVFQELLTRCRPLAKGRQKFRFKNPLVSLDSTVIDLCTTLFDWARPRDHRGHGPRRRGLCLVIRLTGVDAETKRPHDLRRVEVYDPDKAETLVFVTNHLAFGATTIAAIDKDRWQIELFVKALKQNLKIKTLVGTSANVLKVQVWTVLIAILLLKYLQLRSRFAWSLSNLVALLRMKANQDSRIGQPDIGPGFISSNIRGHHAIRRGIPVNLDNPDTRYGLDYRQRYRNLPVLGVLKPSALD